jgi:hypothetical protein
MRIDQNKRIPYNYANATFFPNDVYNLLFKLKDDPEITMRLLKGESFKSIALDELENRFNLHPFREHNETIHGWLEELFEKWTELYGNR